jgi:hypothetical protein
MKKVIIFIAVCMLAATTIAQENNANYRSLFGSEKGISHGGYGGLTISYTSLDGKDAIMIGGKGGWIIDHRLTLGLAGNTFVNDIQVSTNANYEEVSLAGSYGGLLIEPVLAPFAPLHITFPIIIGAGGIAHVNYQHWVNDNYIEPVVWDSDAFFVIEPGIELEINVVPFMRASFGASYRHTSLINLPDTRKDALRGLNANFSLKFGKF